MTKHERLKKGEEKMFKVCFYSSLGFTAITILLIYLLFTPEAKIMGTLYVQRYGAVMVAYSVAVEFFLMYALKFEYTRENGEKVIENIPQDILHKILHVMALGYIFVGTILSSYYDLIFDYMNQNNELTILLRSIMELI